MTVSRQPHRHRKGAAFTLLEMMVAASVLVLIIFSLYQMFNQTQRAFRSGVTQVDVNEGGRAAMELLTRELEQVVASREVDVFNLYIATNGDVNPPRQLVIVNPPDGSQFTNTLQDIFFLKRDGLDWAGIGYSVTNAVTNDLNLLRAGVGSLHRFATNTTSIRATSNAMIFSFLSTTNFQRIIDGVIKFQVRALDADGRELYFAPPGTLSSFEVVTDNLPAYLELELGVIEPSVLEVIRARTEGQTGPAVTATIRTLLDGNANRIHYFRQRIAIRSVPR